MCKECHEAEKLMRSHHSTYFTSYKNKMYVIKEIKTNIFNHYTNVFANCENQVPFLDSHSSQLICIIILKYVDTRMFHEVRKINDDLHKKGREQS